MILGSVIDCQIEKRVLPVKSNLEFAIECVIDLPERVLYCRLNNTFREEDSSPRFLFSVFDIFAAALDENLFENRILTQEIFVIDLFGNLGVFLLKPFFNVTKMFSEVVNTNPSKVVWVLSEVVNQIRNIVETVVNWRGSKEVEFLLFGEFRQKLTTVGTGIPKMVCFIYDNNVLVLSEVVVIFSRDSALAAEIGMQLNIVVFAE